MAPDDSPELDPKLQEMVQKAVEEVRGEFLRKLQETRERLEGLVRGDEPEAQAMGEESEAPEGDAEIETPDFAAIEEEEVAPPPSFADLLAAVAAIDRSRSQTEILTSLLEAASGPHSRAALFLTRPEGLLGWAGRGFGEADDAFDGHLVEYGEGTPWARFAKGTGSTRLSTDHCVEFCSGLEVDPAESGLLLPIVLRDRLAAALYVDRSEGSADHDPAALQVATYVATQALETLPLRSRAATATLRWSEEAAEDVPELPLWEAASATAAVGAVAAVAAVATETPAAEEAQPVETQDEEAPAVETQAEEWETSEEPAEEESQPDEEAEETHDEPEYGESSYVDTPSGESPFVESPPEEPSHEEPPREEAEEQIDQETTFEAEAQEDEGEDPRADMEPWEVTASDEIDGAPEEETEEETEHEAVADEAVEPWTVGEPPAEEAEETVPEPDTEDEPEAEEPTRAEITGFAMESIPAPELEGPDPYDEESVGAGPEVGGYPSEPSPWPISGETIQTGDALVEDEHEEAAEETPAEVETPDAEEAEETVAEDTVVEDFAGEEPVVEEPVFEEPEVEAAEIEGFAVEDATADDDAETEEPAPQEVSDDETPAVEEPVEAAEAVEAVEAVETLAGEYVETVAEAPEPAPQAEEESPPTDSTQPIGVPVTGVPGSGSQVVPPEDVEGPGWAFSGSGASDGSLESRMEEAKRLARLLVTEIKLYNEEQVAEGRDQGNIYGVLKDDIDRSRVIFEERVDDDVREEQDFFREELVRILAGGNEDVLGD